MVRLVTRLARARFSQVGDRVSQVKDLVDQGQGKELDNLLYSSKNPILGALEYIFSRKRDSTIANVCQSV